METVSLRICTCLIVLIALVKSDVKFIYTEGTKFGDYVRVSTNKTLCFELNITSNGTESTDVYDHYNAWIYLVTRNDQKIMLALYNLNIGFYKMLSDFNSHIGNLSLERIQLINLDESFNNYRLSIDLQLKNASSSNSTDDKSVRTFESAFFLIPINPEIQCNQLNHNFDGETMVECKTISHPAVSIIPTFASATITSYDLFVDQLNVNHTLKITPNTYIIKFTPNLSIVNSKMTITAVLDSYYSDDGSGKLVHKFEQPVSASTEVRLKYNNLLQMECTRMFMVENDFAFKCVATNMSNVDFSVEKLVAKTQPKIDIIKVSPWATVFNYRIRSDIDIVNKTVVVSVKPTEGGNSVKSIINFELPMSTPPFNITFTLNGKEGAIQRLECENLFNPFNIGCSAYSMTEKYHTYITTPNGKIYKDGDVNLENLLGEDTFGGWTCHATNEFGISTTAFMDLILEDMPCNSKLIYEGYITYNNNTNIHAIEQHQNVKFQCHSLSYPKPVVYSLQKIRDRYQQEVSYQSENGQFYLDIHDKSFSGSWKCSIFNILGEIHSEEVSFMILESKILKSKGNIYIFYLAVIMVIFLISAIVLGFFVIYLCLKSIMIMDQSLRQWLLLWIRIIRMRGLPIATGRNNSTSKNPAKVLN